MSLGAVDGTPRLLRAGETFTLEPGQFHLPACHGDEAVEFEATLTPGLDSARMFEGIYRSFRERRGLARLVHLAGVFTRHAGEIRFPSGFAMVLRGLSLFAPRAPGA